MIDINIIVDKLLDMKPDPIPKFILLKEFKRFTQSNCEYQNAYDRVCNHPFVKKIENEQNDRGLLYELCRENLLCLQLQAIRFRPH